ncbi:MAG: DNA-binding response regulator [Oleiphilus sp.]|nr:MAG: DNA-binding response regulator [Oleiphilus sp.]
MKKILLIEDDQEINDLLSELLSNEGFYVTQCFEGESGERLALLDSHDLIVLDIMLPKKNGLDVLRDVRGKVHTPVIMLTAKGEDIDRIIGLELGADDYLPKPFNPRELIARINAQLRRRAINEKSQSTSQALSLGALHIQPKSREVKYNDEAISLTGTEYALLIELVSHQGEIVTKDALSELVLGRRVMQYDRAIDMHISNLRKKLPQLSIKTVRGAGYMLETAAQEEL